MTQLEMLFKQHNIYISSLDFYWPMFRCHFVIPKLKLSYYAEGKSLRQLQNRMVEKIERSLKYLN